MSDAVWRTGRKVGRTIYAQLGTEPSDDDPLIGVMDTPELAAAVVAARAELAESQQENDRLRVDHDRFAEALACVTAWGAVEACLHGGVGVRDYAAAVLTGQDVNEHKETLA